ncbi:hypothetical protein [Thermococcus sp.]|uniref:hypothetical protein n=1 Tax=Thermococcus sp. TaxID=35749 RepID=UPI0025D26A6E|nr:hypothetical protein [Thermococcus sp.]
MRQKVVWFILGVLVGSLFVVSAYPTNGNIKSTNLGEKINNTVPVYYIGSDIPKYFVKTRRVNPNQDIRTPHILIVESSYVENNPSLKQLVRMEILSGIPVIVIGNPSIINGTFKGQFFAELVAGRGPNGKINHATVYGYVVYSHKGILQSREFVSIDSVSNALREAYEWAVKNIKPNIGSFKLGVEPLSSGAYWSYQSQLDFTTGDSWKPYGRLNVRTIYYKLMNDGSSQYDWYDVHVRQQSIPGKELGWSDWRTARMYTWIKANYYNPNCFLSDYSPTTTSGTTTVGVSIGVSVGDDGAQVSASQSWSYTIPDVQVYDESDYSQELAKWVHKIAPDKAVGMATYQIEPGATLRFREWDVGAKVWREHYGVLYAKPPSWWEPRWYWHYTGEDWVEFRISIG